VVRTLSPGEAAARTLRLLDTASDRLCLGGDSVGREAELLKLAEKIMRRLIIWGD